MKAMALGPCEVWNLAQGQWGAIKEVLVGARQGQNGVLKPRSGSWQRESGGGRLGGCWSQSPGSDSQPALNGSWHMVGAGLADNCERLRVLQGAEGRTLKGLFPSPETPRLLPTHLLSGENVCQHHRQCILFYFVLACVCVGGGMMCHLEVRGQPWVSLSAFQLVEMEPPCWHCASRQTTWPRRFSCFCLPPRHRRALHLALQVLSIKSQVC